MCNREPDNLRALAEFLTIGEIIACHAEQTPDRIALSFDGRSTSYARLVEDVDLLCRQLAYDGIRAGDRVAYLGQNSDRYFVLLYAIAALRAVLVPMNWRLAEDEWRYIISNSGAVRLFCDTEFAERASRLAGLAGLPLRQCETPDTARFLPDAPGSSMRDDVVLQIYTSGTTGQPKGALLTHRNLLALRAPGYAAELAWFPRRQDCSLLVLPVAHIAGTAYALFGLYGGGRVVIAPEFDARTALRLIEQEAVTHVLLAPSALQILIDHPDLADRDLSSFRYLTYGASPMPTSLLDRAFDALSCGFVQMYGMTETAGGVVALTPEDHEGDRARLNSAGRAMPGVEVAIAGPVGTDEIGEILIRSEAVMPGYWRLPEATIEAIDQDGWLRTGDIGRIDADGYVYVLDRAKDMIVSGGENVYPAEVENILYSHPDIVEAAVVGVSSARWGEVPAVAVVVRPGAVFDLEALQLWCTGRLARFKIPKHLMLLSALPRNAGNKILKDEVRKCFAGGDQGL